MKNKINIILIAVTIMLAIISYFVLPDVVAVQIGFDGQVTNTLSKFLAIILPVCLSLVGCLINSKENKKGMLVSGIAILVMIVTIIFNR